ncbi:gamma-glutamyl-gamma-aminobutyrate hydrolase family protein [Oceanicella sp. SM1341]|uniref:gamma-glutamyl-gamma-aminobutyrate hydrolase family protein n=1 Tax=Oceanicella sp. SM1341 TaxID=1548889 RepID=UPI000E49C208|nr:gamma-glutamyl-gamma-aminobutyrate hydrolase family protein [Oceanicella sp. SM1341]
MARPVIGIIGNHHLINNDYRTQAAGEMNIAAVADVCDAVPLIVPSMPEAVAVADLVEACAGFVFTGGRPNVHPSLYGHEETPGHGPFDPRRDGLTLPLIRACVERGIPILGLCRGFQEFAVAYGSTLHPEIRDLPGRMNHRMPPDGTLEEKFALRHPVNLTPGGKFAQLFGSDVIQVNSLHGQGVIDAGSRVVIEGYAPDGTAEALHIAGACNFAMAVQWHAEWRAGDDPVSRALFTAFAEATHGRLKSAAA